MRSVYVPKLYLPAFRKLLSRAFSCCMIGLDFRAILAARTYLNRLVELCALSGVTYSAYKTNCAVSFFH